jgi:KDO2-lipid IV(A) lauroyltransferase
MLTIKIGFHFTLGKMNFKKIRYGLGDLIAYYLLLFSIPIFRSLPPKALILMSRIMGTITFYLFRKYRERVMENLLIAFGREKDLDEMKIIARKVFFHFTLTLLETIYLIAAPFKPFLLKIKIKGREHLDVALSRGKGVIALGAHLGSFTLLGTRLATEGYPFNFILNESNFPKLWKRLETYQTRVGQKFFYPRPVTSSIKKSLNCLRRNEILYLVADEQQRRGGLPVPFFGQKAFTPSGPAIFSLKTGAPILPMFVLRENGIERTLLIGNPIEIERTLDEQKDIERLTAKFTKVIEEMVRQYPSQWAWLNRRWKQPHQSEI